MSTVLGEQTSRHLVVAQEPGPGRDLTRRVLDSQSGRRLAQLAGTTLEHVLRYCQTVNVKPTGTETGPQTRGYGRQIARDWQDGQYDTILLLGDLAQRVVHAEGHRVFVIPHTSGLNRWWNDPANLAYGRGIATQWWKTVTS